jgi:SAM-dependent methyltransferase
MSDPTHGPNAEQATYWNETGGPTWVALQERIDAQIAPIGLEAIERAAPRPGERCLDVGCGCGETSIQLAERVGPKGQVLGVDLSGPMLERARERAAEKNVPAEFERADAQIHVFAPGRFDLVFSRFGVMFFEDPVAAFANLHAALSPGGRLAFACWRAFKDNEWVTVPMRAAARHVPLPEPGDPNAPGPPSLGDPERIRGILGKAGFEDVKNEPHDLPIDVGGGAAPDELIDFVLKIGPTARMLAAAEADASTIAAVRDEVRAAIEPHMKDGHLRLGSATWLVTARA